MSTEKPPEWHGSFARRLMVVDDHNAFLRWATPEDIENAAVALGKQLLPDDLFLPSGRADLDKALDAIGLRAVSRHMTAIGEAALEELREKAEERDAAISAKEAAEASERVAAEGLAAHMQYSAKTRNVVGAARALWEHMPKRTVYTQWEESLRDSLRALDAGEAPRPNDDGWKERYEQAARDAVAANDAYFALLEKTRPAVEELRAAHDRIRELQSDENPVVKGLRSALARAEEGRTAQAKELVRFAGALAESEKREAELRADRDRIFDGARAEFAALVERTAKATREKIAQCVSSWEGSPALGDQIRKIQLVTLSTLPEADSSGGGEEARADRVLMMGLYGVRFPGRANPDAIAAEIASWDAGPCCFCVDDEGDDSDECGAPGTRVTFRRKHDGLTVECFRCEKHRYLTNEYWAPDPAPPKSDESKSLDERFPEAMHAADEMIGQVASAFVRSIAPDDDHPSAHAKIDFSRVGSVAGVKEAPDGGGEEEQCNAGPYGARAFARDVASLAGIDTSDDYSELIDWVRRMHQRAALNAAESKAEAIDEWTNCRCDEVRTWSPSRWPHIFVLLDVIKLRNAHVANANKYADLVEERAGRLEAYAKQVEEDAKDEQWRLRTKCSRQRKELAALNRKLLEIRGAEFWWRNIPKAERAEGFVWLRKQYKYYQERCRTLESSDALARARCAELEAELAEARKREGPWHPFPAGTWTFHLETNE